MTGTERCSTCNLVPEVKRDGKKVVLLCPLHGHMAVGDSLSEAIANWNIYINFVRGDNNNVR